MSTTQGSSSSQDQTTTTPTQVAPQTKPQSSKYEPPNRLFDILLDPNTATTANLDPGFEASFKRMSHLSYILSVDDHDDQLYFHVIDYLRMSGLYWALMALYLAGGIKYANQETILKFVQDCYDPVSGGYRGNINHSVHLLYTLSAVQIAAIFDRLDLIDVPKLVSYISTLQRPDGSFVGDAWGEVDTRFSYCAMLCLAIVKRLPSLEQVKVQAIQTQQQSLCDLFNAEERDNKDDQNNNHSSNTSEDNSINFAKAIQYVLSCRNFDGGFGAVSGGESHSGQIFCSLAFLCLLGVIPYSMPVPNAEIETQKLAKTIRAQQSNENDQNAQNDEKSAVSDSNAGVLGWWLCERQLDNGGLNGRPEKKEDVCYSWWVLTSLTMLKRTHWINKKKLTNFILSCQDSLYGGISDRSNTMTDIYHTYFGIAGLSLLGNPGLELVEPVYALPVNTVRRLLEKGD